MQVQDRELLLEDICSRLPYGVVAEFRDSETNEKSLCKIIKVSCSLRGNPSIIGAEKIGSDVTHIVSPVHCVRPYLFPLSTLTKNDEKELSYYSGISRVYNILYPNNDTSLADTLKGVRWLYAHHYDVNGLIPMGLANDATGLNIY